MKGGDILDFQKGGNCRKGGGWSRKGGMTPLTKYVNMTEVWPLKWITTGMMKFQNYRGMKFVTYYTQLVSLYLFLVMQCVIWPLLNLNPRLILKQLKINAKNPGRFLELISENCWKSVEKCTLFLSHLAVYMLESESCYCT